MVIVDTALEERHAAGNPVCVAMVGAGYMGTAIALQMVSAVRGMRLVAICNRTVSKAEQAYRQAGVESIAAVHSARELEACIAQGKYAVTDDPDVVCQAGNIDA